MTKKDPITAGRSAAIARAQREEDDDIGAEAKRLRLSGWTAPPRAFTPEQHRHVRRLQRLGHRTKPLKPAVRFGALEPKVKEAAMWLVANRKEAGYLPRSYLVDHFGLSFDEAGRVVAEAERLLGGEL